jgi:hypothetical protein
VNAQTAIRLLADSLPPGSTVEVIGARFARMAVLQVDHKDGDPHNNALENLQLVEKPNEQALTSGADRENRLPDGAAVSPRAAEDSGQLFAGVAEHVASVTAETVIVHNIQPDGTDHISRILMPEPEIPAAFDRRLVPRQA